jgi:hypothetical protein
MRKLLFAFIAVLIPALLWAAFGVDTVSDPAAVETVSSPAKVDTVEMVAVAYCTSPTAPPSLVCEDAEGSISITSTGFDTSWRADGGATGWTANIHASATLIEAAHTNAGWGGNTGDYAIRIYVEENDEASLLTDIGDQTEIYIEMAIDVLTVTNFDAWDRFGLVWAADNGNNFLWYVSMTYDAASNLELYAKFRDAAGDTETLASCATAWSEDDPFCIQIYYKDATSFIIKSDAACDGTFETTECADTDIGDGVYDDTGVDQLYIGAESASSNIGADENATYELDLIAVDTTAPGIH